MKIFIIIPLFNEEKHIGKVLKDLAKYQLPTIVVDDGSKDGSRNIVKKAKFKNVNLLEHKINLGKGASMKTGAEYAFSKGADAVVFMDADGQHEPKDLALFLDALKSNKYEVIFGSRNYGYGVPLVRYLGNKFASIFIGFLFKIYVSDVICGFKAITKKAYDKVKWESGGYGVETEIVARVGRRKMSYLEVPVAMIYHDKTKGVTLLDAIGIFGDVIKWKLTIK